MWNNANIDISIHFKSLNYMNITILKSLQYCKQKRNKCIITNLKQTHLIWLLHEEQHKLYDSWFIMVDLHFTAYWWASCYRLNKTRRENKIYLNSTMHYNESYLRIIFITIKSQPLTGFKKKVFIQKIIEMFLI